MSPLGFRTFLAKIKKLLELVPCVFKIKKVGKDIKKLNICDCYNQKLQNYSKTNSTKKYSKYSLHNNRPNKGLFHFSSKHLFLCLQNAFSFLFFSLIFWQSNKKTFEHEFNNSNKIMQTFQSKVENINKTKFV